MSKIPTVKEFLKGRSWKSGMNLQERIHESMIEFAKLHVEAALKQAEIEGQTNWGNSKKMKDAILNAYPLTNIK